MAEYTENYSLVKPEQNEYYDVDIFNANADAVDAALAAEVARTTGLLAEKADLIDGKVPDTQLPDMQEIQDATLEQKGVVQLEDSVTSDSVDTAAVPNSVKTVFDALSSHAVNTGIHVTAERQQAWDSGAALAADAIPKSEKGKPYGVAPLDADAVVPDEHLPPSALLSDLGELDDIEIRAGTIQNAGAGWNQYQFPLAFSGVPSVTASLSGGVNGIVNINNVTAQGFQYQVMVPSGSNWNTTGNAVLINYIAIYDGEEM